MGPAYHKGGPMSLGVPGITLDMMIFMILFSNKKPGKDVTECLGSLGKHPCSAR